MIPSTRDCGRPFRSGEYDTHAGIQFGYLTQQTLLQGTKEIALKQWQQEAGLLSWRKVWRQNEKAKMS